MMSHKVSREELKHYNCKKCNKWWSISDGPDDPRELYCPWCGTKGNKTSLAEELKNLLYFINKS